MLWCLANFGVLKYLAVQSYGQKEQSSIKAPCWAKYFLMLEKKGRSQTARLHWWFEVHVVLIQNPLRTGQDAKVVGCQWNWIPTCSCRSKPCRLLSSYQIHVCYICYWICIANDDWPLLDSLTCSIAWRVLIPASLKSRRRPPLSPSFTCWNPAEICRTADTKQIHTLKTNVHITYKVTQLLDQIKLWCSVFACTFCRKWPWSTFLAPSTNQLPLSRGYSCWCRLSSLALLDRK